MVTSIDYFKSDVNSAFSMGKKQSVKVLDACMGSGKTTGMFNVMKSLWEEDKSKKFMYISLFLNEVGNPDRSLPEEERLGRIQKELPEMNFKMPFVCDETGKLGTLEKYLIRGNNIASTHALFEKFTEQTVKLMIEQDYHLIIDEAVDSISQYKGLCSDDVKILASSNTVKIHDDGLVEWVDQEVNACRYSDIISLCNMGSLYLYKDSVVIWEYPPLLLKELNHVYIISYLFDGSIMSCWLQKNNIPYEYIPHSVLGLRSSEDIKKTVRENIEIINSAKINKLRKDTGVRENLCSVGWYKRHKEASISEGDEAIQTVKQSLISFVSRYKTKEDKIFWTTYKYFKSDISGKGYARKGKDKLEPFLSFNTKATNMYREYNLCAYCVNIFKTPIEVNYLKSKGIDFNSDLYALSEMIQWVFRGCIREGKPMKLLIVSDRMERLFMEWLETDS